MIGDAMIITVSVCLFIYLGLFDAISSVLGRILPATPGKTERIGSKADFNTLYMACALIIQLRNFLETAKISC